jgi:hypothetical protein
VTPYGFRFRVDPAACDAHRQDQPLQLQWIILDPWDYKSSLPNITLRHLHMSICGPRTYLGSEDSFIFEVGRDGMSDNMIVENNYFHDGAHSVMRMDDGNNLLINRNIVQVPLTRSLPHSLMALILTPSLWGAAQRRLSGVEHLLARLLHQLRRVQQRARRLRRTRRHPRLRYQAQLKLNYASSECSCRVCEVAPMCSCTTMWCS